MSLRKRLGRGDHMIWLTGSALGICLLMIFGLLLIILVNGLGIFWPSSIVKVTTREGSVLAGEIAQREAAGVERGVHAHLRELVVVEARAAHAALVEVETERLHQVQRRAGVRAQADHVTGVGRNLRLA